MIELIFVIVVVSILSIVSVPNFNKDTAFYIDGEKVRDAVSPELIKATNQVLSHIRYTRHLALIDNKFQPYRLDSSVTETSRSKYWFKSWWQIRFSYGNDDNGRKNNWYTIFQDIPTDNSYNFDADAHLPSGTNEQEKQFAKDPLTKKYMMGWCDRTHYPSCDEVNQNLNLTKKYDINYVNLNNSTYLNGGSERPRLLFDNMGRVYFWEGIDGDGGDINPYEFNERKILRETVKLTLCKTDPCSENNLSICIAPETGYSYICK